MLPLLGAVLPALIAGGASLAGGAMNSASSARASRMNLINSAMDREYNERIWREQVALDEARFQTQRQDQFVANDRSEALAREFAKMGVQWRVADAKAAGLHPLAALGMQASQGPSVQAFTGGGSIPGGPQHRTPQVEANHSMGNAVASMGQDISRALQATRTEDARVQAVNKTVEDLQVQRLGLENELLASQIRKTNLVGPAMPDVSRARMVDGQGNSPRVKMKPAEIVYSSPSNAVIEPKPITDVSHAQTRDRGGTGYHYPVPSKDVKERIEDNFIPELMWGIRNNIAPMFGANYNPPDIKIRGDQYWDFHPLYGYFQKNRAKERSLFHRNPNR